jgi:hypothetical protein
MPTRQFPGVQIFGSGIAVFAASWCYAKITPALLHRGEIAGRCCELAEAAGRKLEFEMSDFLRLIALAAFPVVQSCSMASS